MSQKKTETRTPTSHIAPFGLRMQSHLRDKLESAAAAAGRSLNSEIVERLEASFMEPSSDLGKQLDELKQRLDHSERQASLRRVGETALAAMLGLIARGHISGESVEAQKIKKRAKENSADPFAQLLAKVLDNEIELPQEQITALVDSALKGLSTAMADLNKEDHFRKSNLDLATPRDD